MNSCGCNCCKLSGCQTAFLPPLVYGGFFNFGIDPPIVLPCVVVHEFTERIAGSLHLLTSSLTCFDDGSDWSYRLQSDIKRRKMLDTIPLPAPPFLMRTCHGASIDRRKPCPLCRWTVSVASPTVIVSPGLSVVTSIIPPDWVVCWLDHCTKGLPDAHLRMLLNVASETNRKILSRSTLQLSGCWDVTLMTITRQPPRMHSLSNVAARLPSMCSEQQLFSCVSSLQC